MIRGGGRRDLAGSGGVNVFPWEHTLTYALSHTTVLHAVPQSLRLANVV